MKHIRFGLVALALLSVISACGDDEPSDAVREDGGSDPDTDENTDPVSLLDGGPDVIALSCEGVEDGVSCGSTGGLICLDDVCVKSRCGDSFTNPRTGELCDDGNDVAADGCEPSCKFMCREIGDCDDGNACNGNEVCDTARHLCVGGSTAIDETPCMSAAVDEGECRSGTCVPRGCGDESVEGTEECDDGNQVSGDGCEPTCTYTCEEDGECDDNNVCNGAETCDVEMHACVAGTALECDGKDECTQGSCDPERGCQLVPVDADGDGYPPDSLACGSDCDDTRADVNPGQVELCDEVDQDCDGDPQPRQTPTWYVDCDADGFAAMGATARKQCAEPAPTACGGRWTTRAPSNDSDPPTADCLDSNADAHPGQDAWYRKPSESGFDYNCDGAEERRWKTGKQSATASCLSLGCTGPSGWTGLPPACGERAEFTECQVNSGQFETASPSLDPPLEPCGIRICECSRVTVQRDQECH